jgi:twitching motility two-component system response regulator PilG
MDESRTRPSGQTILAVDDSASVRKLVEITLRREGFSVLEATSGVEALAQIAEHAVDLILLDVMLDALDGFQLCSAIRRNPRVGSIPIVILSGRETDDDRARGESVGVDAYLTKPFQPRELLDVVYAQLRDSVDGTSP